MSSRKPGYLIGVILLALVLSAPQLFVSFHLGVDAYQRGRWPLTSVPGFGGPMFYGSYLSSGTFWRDKFLTITYHVQPSRGEFDWCVYTIDPESGESNDTGWSLAGRNYYQTMSFGDRVWFVGNTESYELVDGTFQPAQFVMPRSWPGDGQRFLLNGEPAYVERQNTGFAVSTMKVGTWGTAGVVIVPARYGDWALNPQQGSWMACVNQGDRVHVFLHIDGRLLYREGLEVQTASAQAGPRNRQFSSGIESADEPASALWTANSDGQASGWTLVREQQRTQPSTPIGQQNYLFGFLVGGMPAALIVDDEHDGYLVGHLYRFDGSNWSESATHTFPFGTNMLRVVPCRDGQKSYIVASTTTGAAHVFAVETTGFRATNGASQQTNPAINTLRSYTMIPAAMLVLGIILGLGTWCLMWWSTKPDYGFGVHNVKLASLGRRGLARLIDLGLILLTTAGLCWVLTRGFDWVAWLEAVNLKVDHPTIPIAARVALILALWLVAVVLSLLATQAQWGITPGKWLCGLRTLRATLKPCGFARSLVRETVMCVDACNFLCWTPGIVCIAFTDCRHRLGDLVADTLVVEVRSLSSRMSA